MLVLVLACREPAREIEALRREAASIAAARAPALDALVARIARLKRDLRGNRTGWETMLRIAELANDELGLPPFTQEVPPGPAWRPSPATLLGIAAQVRRRAGALADVDALEHLVADERRRYDAGIREVSGSLAQVETWLGSTITPR